MMDTTVLIAEDDRQVRDALERILVFEGYRVVTTTNGAEALDAVERDRPDVIVLDIMMPVVDGLDTCRRLRERGDRTPILMLTARTEVSDRVAGLDAGADDYLPKPFALEELLARVRALLRRTGDDEDAGPSSLGFADLELDLAGRVAHRGDRAIALTRTEFRILELLMRHPGTVLDKMTMYSEIWGYDGETSSKALDVHTRYVRHKLELGGEPRLVHTVHGVGYVLREPIDTVDSSD